MLFEHIFLQASTFKQDLPVGLLLCIVPAILGWLAAYAYYVSPLKTKLAEMTAENGSLNMKVNNLSTENTDLRVKLTQADSELHTRAEQIRKLKNDLIICESDFNVLKGQVAEKGGASAKAAVAPPQSITFAGTKYKTDDLKIVEGIGPKIAELLNEAGIKTWTGLAGTPVSRLDEILEAAGPNFQIHSPGTWPEQARLAAAADWEALKKLQEELDGGKA